MAKVLLRAAFATVGVVGLFLVAVYAGSEYELRRFQAPVISDLDVVSDSASIANGRHVARTRGCFGCHGQQLQGRVFTDQWDWVKRAVAPNLVTFATENSAETIDAAVRHGIGADGKALFSMPSYNWVHLSDNDMGDLIAFLRSSEESQSAPFPRPRLGFAARWAILSNRDATMPELVDLVPDLLIDASEDSLLERGQYLAMTSCNECHGFDLRGEHRRGVSIPDLAIVSGYSDREFEHLMRSGKAKGDRELRLMSMIARDRFAYFTDDELRDIRRFLLTLPDRPVPAPVEWRVAD